MDSRSVDPPIRQLDTKSMFKEAAAGLGSAKHLLGEDRDVPELRELASRLARLEQEAFGYERTIAQDFARRIANWIGVHHRCVQLVLVRLDDCKGVEGNHVAGGVNAAAVGGELICVNWDFLSSLSLRDSIVKELRLLIEPGIKGVGELRVVTDGVADGFKVIAAEPRDVCNLHN